MNPSPSQKQTDFQWTYAKGLVLLIVLGVIGYANAIFLPFVHDEIVFIKNNPQIGDLRNLGALFFQTSSPSFPLANPYYRPLMELLVKFQYQLFRANAWGYHLFNITLHILNSCLVFTFLRRLCKKHMGLNGKGLAFPIGIAAFFLIHPVQTEAVTCISGLSNLIITALTLLILLIYIRNREDEKVPKRKYLVSSVIALFVFLVALFLKEQAIVLPLLLSLYEACFPCSEVKQNELRQNSRGPYAPLAGFFLVAFGYLLWRRIVLGSALPNILSYRHELFLRLIAIPRTLLMHLRVLCFPNDLHYYRSVDILEPAGISPLLLLVIVGGVVLIIRALDKGNARLAIFGVGWFLITLLPTLNILPLIHEYSLIAAFEHFLYLPLLGFLLFFFVVGNYFLDRYCKNLRKFKFGLISVLVCFCVVMTIKQNTFWRGEIPLFERVVRFEKSFGRAHLLLAKAYFHDQKYAEAEREYNTAFKIMDSYVRKAVNLQAKSVYIGYIKEIYFGSARIFEIRGDFVKAIAQYEKALMIDPLDGIVHNSLGMSYLQINEVDKAMSHFRQALAINTEDPAAMMNLAGAHIQKKEYAEAERLLRQVLASGDFPGARENLEMLLKKSTDANIE